MGLPLLHISFKYGPHKIPVPAKGIIAIGQFGIGIINISQFGLGIFSISQFTVAAFALAQVAAAYSLIAQVGFYSAALIGLLVKGKFGKMFTIPFYFCLINLTALTGFINYIGGRRQSVWEVAKTTR